MKIWSLRSNSVTRHVNFHRTKIVEKSENSNETFCVIFKQRGCSKKLWKEGTRILSLRLKYFRTGFCNSCSCSASCWLMASADSSSAFSLAFRLDLEKAEVSSTDSVSCFSALFRLCFKLLFLPKRPFQRTRVFLGSTSAKVSSYLK